MPREVPTVEATLATGKNVDSQIGTAGVRSVYEKALGKALARGIPINAAVAYAKRVEAATVMIVPLPPALAKKVSATGTVVKVTTVSGKPLPGWLRYDAERKAFVVNEAPPGALPMEVAVTVNGNRSVQRVSEVTNHK
jgi:hypothetical protein